MLTTDINNILQVFTNHPKYPDYNFQLAYAYESNGHNASAFSFYLRTAELSTNDLFQYECLLRMAICLDKLGNRVHSMKGVILRAVSLFPRRPEALFMIAQACERNKDWHEAYSYACIGEALCNDTRTYFEEAPLMTDVDFPGSFVFTYERAVAAWWIGLYDESLHLFRQLDKITKLDPRYKASIKGNIDNLGYQWKKEIRYESSMHPELRLKFEGSETIPKNYSQCFQDMFVLTMLNGKKFGRFLEIGCGDPYFSSNTALLETLFDWNGISIDIDKDKIERFKKERTSTALAIDALVADYDSLLSEGDYDFLQLDCEPAITTYEVMQRIPFDKHRFAVVTFEHDNFCDNNPEIKERSRKYLRSYGYEMVVNNISEDRFSDYEDWWVHPDLVSREIINIMKCISDKPKRADHYMLGRIVT